MLLFFYRILKRFSLICTVHGYFKYNRNDVLELLLEKFTVRKDLFKKILAFVYLIFYDLMLIYMITRALVVLFAVWNVCFKYNRNEKNNSYK